MNNSYLHIPLILVTITALTISLSHAQVSSQSQSTHKYKGYVQPYDLKLYREVAGQRQQVFDQHIEIIQNKIDNLFQRVNDLESLDHDAARLAKEEIQKYVNRLSNTKIDYSDYNSYNSVLNALKSYDGDISYLLKEALGSTRQQRELGPNLVPNPNNINRVAKTFTYAPIFQKPNLSSTKVHSVDDKETVTILKEEGSFYYVRCSTYEGYLSKGMIEKFFQ